MTTEEIKSRIENSEEYKSLRDLQSSRKICILGLGGSYAYGTNNEDSDIDIRGVAMHTADEILTGTGFEQFEDNTTDTVVYSLEKIISLLSNCNPNVIEILGLEPWQYLLTNDIGKDLIKNADMFLSKKAINSFGGYANAQLRRLENKTIRDMEQSRREQHILNSIKNACNDFPSRYFNYDSDSIKLYIDDAVQEDFDTEIFMDVCLKHYPLRDYKAMWSEMNSIVKDYAKIGKRNKNAIEHNKLGKHMMHLVRLYLMCFDILQDGKIVTYRRSDHDFLMDIRNGKYLDEHDKPNKEFYEIVDELENKLDYLKEHTELPKNPDYNRINTFLRNANLGVVLNEYSD